MLKITQNAFIYQLSLGVQNTKKNFTFKFFLFINLHYQAEENLDITTAFII